MTETNDAGRSVEHQPPSHLATPRPHFCPEGRGDRARTLSHLEKGEKGQEVEEVRRGKKGGLFRCDERNQVEPGHQRSSFFFPGKRKEKRRIRGKQSKQQLSFSLNLHPQPPRATSFSCLSVPSRLTMATLRMISGSMTSTRFCGGPTAAARVSLFSLRGKSFDERRRRQRRRLASFFLLVSGTHCFGWNN